MQYSRGGKKSKRFSPASNFTDHTFTMELSGVDSAGVLRQSVCDIVELNCCLSSNVKFMLGDCGMFDTPAAFNESVMENADQVSYKNWCQVDMNIQKVMVTENGSNSIVNWKEFVNSLKKKQYTEHDHNLIR